MKKIIVCAVFLIGAASAHADTVQRLDPIVVTASRSEESLIDSGKSVTIISREEIAVSGARTVPELLQGQAGVDVRDYLGNGKSAQVDIRGFGETAGSNTLVLIDGRRTNQIDISGVDWTQINIQDVDRIEIVRGSQSVLYGDNAVGGVINIITKKGTGKKSELGFSYELGSYDFSSYHGFSSAGSDFLDYYVSFTQTSTDGYRVNSDLETIDVSNTMAIKPSDWLRINVSDGYHKDWYGMPGALTQSDLDAVGRRGSVYPNDRSKTEDFYVMAGPELTGDFNFGNIKLTCDMLTRGRRTSSIAYSMWGTTEISNHIKTFGVTPKIVFESDPAGMHNRLVLGADYYGNKDDITSGSPSAPKDKITITKDSFGLYAEDTVNITPDLSLRGGYRAEWGVYDFDQQAVLVGHDERSPFEYACEAGVNYKYNDRSSVYASYARSFRFPAVDEWYNALWSFWGMTGGGLNLDLEPQTANTYEIGIRDNTWKRLKTSASCYMIDMRNELYYNPVTWENSVYDHTVHQGFELDARFYPVDELETFITYTYENAFFVGGDFAGNRIPMVPANMITGGLSYTYMKCFTVAYVTNFVGSRYFISDQRNQVPKLKSYVTQDIRISYRKYGLEIWASFNNIWDERYCDYAVTNAAGSTQAYYPSPGRNAVMGVNYKF